MTAQTFLKAALIANCVCPPFIPPQNIICGMACFYAASAYISLALKVSSRKAGIGIIYIRRRHLERISGLGISVDLLNRLCRVACLI